MRLRDRIADWLTGGALSAAIKDAAWWRDHMVDEIYGPMVDEKNRELIRLKRNNLSLHGTVEKLTTCGAVILGREIEAKHALSTISAMETPGGNATVRRMARTANKALEGTA